MVNNNLKKLYMKKLYSLLAALAIFSSAFSQADDVTVTYQVDVTDYLVDFTASETGFRIGGDFATVGAMVVPDWTPSAAESAMTDLGNNIWSIAVTYPASSIGATQQFKFVNGDWGTPGEQNEGGDMSNIGLDGCGSDDGAGNINRLLEIPSEDVTLTFCWEQCTQCDGSDPISNIEELDASISEIEIFPNPTNANTQVTYSLSQTNRVTVQVLDLLGKEVSSVFQGTQSFGKQTLDIDMSTFENGIYFLQVTVGGTTQVSKVIKR